MPDLTSIIVSWNRPEFLARTIKSLREHSSYPLLIVDNASAIETTDLIRSITSADERLLLPTNVGINRAVEQALPRCNTEFVHISDADIQYLEPLEIAVGALSKFAFSVSYQDSPEHEQHGYESGHQRWWFIKHTERGAALFMRTEYLRSLQPFPNKLTEFDWWVCRDSPRSLKTIGQPIWVLPRAAWHLGWRRGASTHNKIYEHTEWYYLSS